MTRDKEVALRRAWSGVEDQERDRIRDRPQRIMVPDGSRGRTLDDMNSTVWTPVVQFERIDVPGYGRAICGFVCEGLILDVELGLPEELKDLIAERRPRYFPRPFR